MDENGMGRDSGEEGSADREKTCIYIHVHSHIHTRTHAHTSAYHALHYTLLHIPYHTIPSQNTHIHIRHTYTHYTHNMPHNTVQHIPSIPSSFLPSPPIPSLYCSTHQHDSYQTSEHRSEPEQHTRPTYSVAAWQAWPTKFQL